MRGLPCSLGVLHKSHYVRSIGWRLGRCRPRTRLRAISPAVAERKTRTFIFGGVVIRSFLEIFALPIIAANWIWSAGTGMSCVLSRSRLAPNATSSPLRPLWTAINKGICYGWLEIFCGRCPLPVSGGLTCSPYIMNTDIATLHSNCFRMPFPCRTIVTLQIVVFRIATERI
jgi:hypothetical protein